MSQYTEGARVRIDIPDTADPDYQEYHGEHGEIIAVLTDQADAMTNDPRDRYLYRVETDNGDVRDFRWRDLRPPLSE